MIHGCVFRGLLTGWESIRPRSQDPLGWCFYPFILCHGQMLVWRMLPSPFPHRIQQASTETFGITICNNWKLKCFWVCIRQSIHILFFKLSVELLQKYAYVVLFTFKGKNNVNLEYKKYQRTRSFNGWICLVTFSIDLVFQHWEAICHAHWNKQISSF